MSLHVDHFALWYAAILVAVWVAFAVVFLVANEVRTYRASRRGGYVIQPSTEALAALTDRDADDWHSGPYDWERAS
jgi:hypothetical protein